jgi:CelD/BcsL family acetyltransferase involved in cellulose biosynthesis
MMPHIEVISTPEAFRTLKREWNELLQQSENTAVCLTHEWVFSWWQCFAGNSTLHIVAIRDGAGRLIALAPMAVSVSPYRGVSIKKISFMANGHSPCADFIVHREHQQEGLAALFSCLSRYTSWQLVELQALSGGSQTLSFMRESAKRAGLPAGLQESIETPFIPISSSWDEFLGSKSAKFRKVLRNKINRAEKAGDITVERRPVRRGDDVTLNDMARVSNRSWKKQIGTDLETSPKSRLFLRAIADQFGQAGATEVWFLKKNGQPIAFEFHVTYNQVVHPIRADYDESFRHISPGSVLEYRILKTLFDEHKVREYNSCGHTYEYLLRWSDETRKHYTLELFGREYRPYLLYNLEYRFIPLLRMLRVNKIKQFIMPRITKHGTD